eukprot:gene11975-20694_t
MDDPRSWTYPSNQTWWVGGPDPVRGPCVEGDLKGMVWLGWANYCGVTNASKIQYTDEDLILAEGLKRLRLAVAQPLPWWVSIGVHRPHSPYRVPQGFYGPDVYGTRSQTLFVWAALLCPGDAIRLPRHPQPPTGVPWMAGNWQNAGERGSNPKVGGDVQDPWAGCPLCIVPDERALEYRRWYLAALTWADHNLGKALALLDDLGETSRTITVFHADHGYHLGELNEWSKKTNAEVAVRIPLLIRAPWKAGSVGARTTVKAELVDLYRTLADLAAGLPAGDAARIHDD